MAQNWYRAMDTFTMDLSSGAQMTVSKNDVLPEGHEVVQHDLAQQKANSGRVPLFAVVDLGEDAKPARSALRKGGSS
jgi:hypothetical protein